ncbi:MAG: low affinity iron permease family protein [Chitinophagaceae bacterium]|nr:low affinity iron permease family protein [Chitinophagaceae bacterium]
MTKKNDQAAQSKKTGSLFNRIATWITHKTGSPAAFIIAASLVIIWGICGPFFHFSDTWQLVINTSTTIITFLMVFIIQQSQNKDTAAIHLKLNELIASAELASNRLIDSEDLTEEELLLLKKFYVKLSEKSLKNNDLHTSHSLDELEEKHIE